MKRVIAKLLSPDESLGGTPYLLLGISLFAVKFAIDSSLSLLILHRPWSVWNYISPGAAIGFPTTDVTLAFAWTMLAISIPFIITGILLTTRRLHTVGLPTWLCMLFFIPLINFLFFLIIGLHPARRVAPLAARADDDPFDAPDPEWLGASPPAPNLLQYGRDQLGPGTSVLARILPRTPGCSALVAILLPIPVGIGMVILGVTVLQTYGWGVFVGLPFVMAMLSVLLRSFHQPLRLGQCLGLATLGILAYSVALMAFAMEGAICILMALPIVIPISLLGGVLGYLIQRARHVNASGIALSLLLFLPLFMGAERLALPDAPLYKVVTSIEVDAPPTRVWKNVVSFRELPPPTEFIFRAGISCPMRAEIVGAGVGATRYCIFSTGPFVEPITIWDEPRLLRFDVTANPPPMREWTPWPDIHPPHLQNFLVSHGGQFKLIELPNNRTRLEGTTWYQHHMWPAGYWRLWSDSIMHKIHLRVLNHVKRLSEADHDDTRVNP